MRAAARGQGVRVASVIVLVAGVWAAPVPAQFTADPEGPLRAPWEDPSVVALTGEAGVGLLAVGMPELGFNAHHDVMADFESPEASYMARHEAENRHTIDVRPRELVSLSLDWRERGIGYAWSEDLIRRSSTSRAST